MVVYPIVFGWGLRSAALSSNNLLEICQDPHIGALQIIWNSRNVKRGLAEYGRYAFERIPGLSNLVWEKLAEEPRMLRFIN